MVCWRGSRGFLADCCRRRRAILVPGSAAWRRGDRRRGGSDASRTRKRDLEPWRCSTGGSPRLRPVAPRFDVGRMVARRRAGRRQRGGLPFPQSARRHRHTAGVSARLDRSQPAAGPAAEPSALLRRDGCRVAVGRIGLRLGRGWPDGAVPKLRAGKFNGLSWQRPPLSGPAKLTQSARRHLRECLLLPASRSHSNHRAERAESVCSD